MKEEIKDVTGSVLDLFDGKGVKKDSGKFVFENPADVENNYGVYFLAKYIKTL